MREKKEMPKNTHILRLMAVAAMLMVWGWCSAQDMAPMTVTAKSDSTLLIMGDRTNVNVEVIKNGHDGALITMPQREKDYYGMEMIDCVVDSTDLGNNRIQLVYHFTFQAFDPNDLLTLPPFRYVSGTDTVASDILTFKVIPVELSPELGDPNQPDSLRIHPDELVISVKSKWYDYIPEWTVWALLGAALVALAVTLYILYKKNGPKIFVARKPIPPYELAIQKLNKLRDKHLIDKGLAKQFYTEVTDIWRTYLEGRFGISAMEMTSRQILQQLRAHEETHLSAKDMEQMLQISDFVKFAAMDPSRDEMLKTYNTIYQFVEATRPAPEPEEEGTKNNKKTEKSKSDNKQK